MKISVKTLSGKTIELHAPETCSVRQLKELIEDKEGIPPDQQRLIFLGKEMEDEVGNELSEKKNLADYGISDGTVVYMVLKLRC